jgi:hypothetical protein
MVLIVTFLLADQVKKSTDAAIVKNDDQEYQNRVKGTHEHEVDRVVCPFKSKWKHGSVLPIVDLAPFLEEKSADTCRRWISQWHPPRQIGTCSHILPSLDDSSRTYQKT